MRRILKFHEFYTPIDHDQVAKVIRKFLFLLELNLDVKNITHSDL